MTNLELNDLKPGDKVFIVHQSFSDDVDFIPLEVVRTGKRFVTVRERRSSSLFWFEPRHLAGRVTDEEWRDW